MTRYAVGLDLSYTSTGIGVLVDGAFSEQWSEVFKTAKSKTSEPYDSIKRAMKVANVVRHKISQLATQAEQSQGSLSVWIEGYAYGAFANRERLGELGGIVKTAILEAGYEYDVLPVTSVRKFVCGKGNARKEMVMMSLLKRYDIEITQNDLADAVGLALTGDAIALARVAAIEKVKLLADAREVVEALRSTAKTREESA